MPCGILYDEEFEFVDKTPEVHRISTTKKDIDEASAKVRALVFRRRDEFATRLGESGGHSSQHDACNPECPRRVYMMSILFDHFFIAPADTPSPGYEWDFKVAGKCRLAIMCVKAKENPQPKAAVAPGPNEKCGTRKFQTRKTVSVTDAHLTEDDLGMTEWRATNEFKEEVALLASRISCLEGCPRTVIFFETIGRNHRFFTNAEGREMVEASLTFDIRVDCVKADTEYELVADQ